MDLGQWEWTCPCCGQRKTGVPDYAFAAPIHAEWADQGDPDFRVLGSSDDFCAMVIAGDRHFFIRGVLYLPITGADQPLGIGAWSTLSEANYRRYAESFEDDGQSRLEAMFGYLANRLPFYPDTLNLRLDVLPQDGRRRPHLRVQSVHADHPLYADQANGLDAGRLAALLGAILPCEGRA